MQHAGGVARRGHRRRGRGPREAEGLRRPARRGRARRRRAAQRARRRAQGARQGAALEAQVPALGRLRRRRAEERSRQGRQEDAQASGRRAARTRRGTERMAPRIWRADHRSACSALLATGAVVGARAGGLGRAARAAPAARRPTRSSARRADVARARAEARPRAASRALVAPAVAVRRHRLREGFAGAISVPAEALTGVPARGRRRLSRARASPTCASSTTTSSPRTTPRCAPRSTGLPAGRASVACPLTRRWARTLSAEFKSGACHAGRYETSLVLAAAPTPWTPPPPALCRDSTSASRTASRPGSTASARWGSIARTRARRPARPPRRASDAARPPRRR